MSGCVEGDTRGDRSKTGKLFWDYILKGLVYHAKELHFYLAGSKE